MIRNSTDDEWLFWIEVQKSVTQTWLGGDLGRAIEILDDFVASDPPLDLKRQAVGFRGSIRQAQGALMKAKSDFLAALALAEEQDFERYTLEESVAVVSSDFGDTAEADRWYIEALTTAAAADGSFGASVLVRLLELRGNFGLTAEERLLAEAIIKQAWHFYKLPGSPSLHDLLPVARVILRAQRTIGE